MDVNGDGDLDFVRQPADDDGYINIVNNLANELTQKQISGIHKGLGNTPKSQLNVSESQWRFLIIAINFNLYSL